ncbi:MAG: PqqD family protein [Kastovskya adunca ATA6-11-RM4]|jgi:hypothetical protein|nr:PqqD family protein [Kastovskya adunca ATA6-11-RM4]
MQTKPELKQCIRKVKPVLCHRHYKLESYPDIPSALVDPNFNTLASKDVVLALSHKGQEFELTMVAAFIWDLLDLDTEPDVPIIADNVYTRFKVDRMTAIRDTKLFLDLLESHGLIEISK